MSSFKQAWTEIDYDGIRMIGERVTVYLNGVLVVIPSSAGVHPVFIPGYYVKQQEAEMDGPALRERRDKGV